MGAKGDVSGSSGRMALMHGTRPQAEVLPLKGISMMKKGTCITLG